MAQRAPTWDDDRPIYMQLMEQIVARVSTARIARAKVLAFQFSGARVSGKDLTPCIS